MRIIHHGPGSPIHIPAMTIVVGVPVGAAVGALWVGGTANQRERRVEDMVKERERRAREDPRML